MKLEQTHIDQIRTAFEKMQSKEDLIHLLNKAQPLVYGEKAVPFELRQLTWYANPKLGNKRYTEFKIKKKSGVERSIHAPIKGLKSLQKTLSFVLQCVYEPHKAAMGFVRDRSILDNAKLHVGSRYIYNIDLKDFFPSIDQARVWKCFQLKPFNLKNTEQPIDVNQAINKLNNFRLVSRFNPALNKDEEILKVKYSDINLIEGWHILLLRSGEKIIYNIEKNDDDKNGVLSIYLLRSSFKLVQNYINEHTPDKKDDESHFYLVVLQLIFAHRNKNLLKNNRSILSNVIAAICCTEMEVERKNDETGEWKKIKRNVLPQGAPTSPVLTNIVCQRLDYLLTAVAKRFGLKYSRYADDITFSSMHNVYQPDSVFLKELNRIIAEQNFHIKESKTRLQKDGYRKEVTGLLVNEKANVQQRYIKQLRMWLYYWEKYGYERAEGFFLQQYIANKGHVKNGKPNMANVISGKMDYLKMVKGVDNELYVKLRSRFEALTGSNNTKSSNPQHLEKVLEILFDRGLEDAMDIYKPNN